MSDVSGMRGDEEQPVLLGAVVARGSPGRAPGAAVARDLGVVAGPPKPLPKGWPVKRVLPMWRWLGTQRAPVTVVVASAGGGVGTSTVAGLLAETFAAGSPVGTTVLVDQCGTPWGTVSRRVLGQRGGLSGQLAVALLRQGESPLCVLRRAPASSAGAAVVLDSGDASPLREMRRLVQMMCGGLVVDAGCLTPWVMQRLTDPGAGWPVVLVVGRADVPGAETVCAALAWMRSYLTVPPVLALVSTTPADRGQIAAAQRLVSTVVPTVVPVPFDARLAHGHDIRLDRLSKGTVAALARLLSAVRQRQEGVSDVAHSR
ncbi:hypothetical protein GCM10012275_43110 [Longimycelium tulufanense]|uniref:CobQ/CobB/MinD/ParA nucleotide binding domain-containing protein n=1 Tax=Longimycelium tulufanense TaxID=907463 RepID=A0A8J3CHL9_9PSEU|nr:hypothetical protein [Longimycelium tulufanense]GGM67909.1 hypothetical protein GCM10012275_43110 [Longimycelium tulufanense]